MTSFNLFISNFHFVRPYWFLAIIALFFVLWLLKRHRFYQSPWQQLLPSHLSHILVEGAANTGKKSKTNNDKAFLLKPFIIGVLTITALAGPVWKKLPQPVYQTERGSVLIMDMSYSMYATDIKPNRLTRARFKAIDLLNKINEGDTGLIAYAGDAFIISPLTQDIKNIELLLPSLSPEIMPKLGSNPLAALTLAHDMLINAGHLNGDIYWFTDDIDNEEISDIYDWTSKYGHQLNILGVGTENGAPITLPSGELLKDNTGAIVVPRLSSGKLKSIASRGLGNYQTIRNDDVDINSLLSKGNIPEGHKKDKQQSQQTGDQWQEQGAWLLLLVLPLMLGYFRRGSTILIFPISCLPLLLMLSFTMISKESFAQQVPAQDTPLSKQDKPSPPEQIGVSRFWNNLWKTNDQQAQQQYNQENYQGAAAQFENPQWQGSAHYKAGNYEGALNAFKSGKDANSADSLYNQGNALAQMQKFEEAIKHYEDALKQNPDLQDAKDNIEKIKQLQKEQEQNQQQGDDSESNDSQDQENNENQQDAQSQENQSQDQQNQQEQQSDGEKNQQQQAEGDKDNDQKENQAEQSEQEQQQEKQQSEQEQQNAKESDEQNKQGEEKSAAQIAAEQQAKETDQKHQQLLNKVTDDPYLLLRNKMQLEYQKRKQEGASQGVKKKW